MNSYLSFSYRDKIISNYFFKRFIEGGIYPGADQKTDIWCVAKLERYLGEMTGFISIIPRRPSDIDPNAYSPYIGQELILARRARMPRLLFVDEQILEKRPLDFPEDAVPFNPNSFDKHQKKHETSIKIFKKQLDNTYKQPRNPKKKQATVITGSESLLKSISEDVVEILKRENYKVTLLSGNRPGRGLDDIRLLETIWQSELCVFVLSDRLSDTHVALAIAHAYCIPSIRLIYDKEAVDCKPSLSGNIRWKMRNDMLTEFMRQIKSYKTGLVSPIEMSLDSSPMNAAISISTMKGWQQKNNYWNMLIGNELIKFINPNEPFVRDEYSRANREIKSSINSGSSREISFTICNILYNGIKRFRYAYEIELQIGKPGFQAIRSPTQIQTHNTATCIDLACLFASLLESADQNPLLVILDQPKPLTSHALVGYRVPGEPQWSNPTIGDLRRDIKSGSILLFEATGAVESATPVGAETQQERIDKLLTFADAKEAAIRMIHNPDVTLRYLIDVKPLR